MLAAILLVMVFGFLAFTVDVGYITYTKAQLQTAADAAALAASLELTDGWGYGATQSAGATSAAARDSAGDIVGRHRAGDVAALKCDTGKDVRLGRREWTGTDWQYLWGVSPYNVVEVTVRRAESTNGKLPLFFAPILGHHDAELSAVAVTALRPGVGFRYTSRDTNPPVLPITLDLPTWELLATGTVGVNTWVDDDLNVYFETLTDHWGYDSASGEVTEQPDGIPEFNLYPGDDDTFPSGNRGTVNIGTNSNSTSTVERQILHGLSKGDLAPYGGELSVEEGPIELSGNPGLSAGLKDSLEAIIGEVRAIPIFSKVDGQGSKATYTIVKFVGVRIFAVQLTGGDKYVTVQPATLKHSTIVSGQVELTDDSILAPVGLVK